MVCLVGPRVLAKKKNVMPLELLLGLGSYLVVDLYGNVWLTLWIIMGDSSAMVPYW